MSQDWNLITRREDLPSVAYTINDRGQLFPIFYGRGVGSLLSASVKPGTSDECPAVLTMTAVLRHGEPVPWNVMRRLPAPEVFKVDHIELQPQPPYPGDRRAVSIDYTNHRGERGIRTIIPTGRMLEGPTEWHPDAPYVIEAWDAGKDVIRTFDPAKIHRWSHLTLSRQV